MKRKSLLLFILSLGFLTGCSNDPVPEDAVTSEKGYTDISGITLKVGSAAPDFSLQSLNGKQVTLSKLRGDKVLMVFYRGHWCPFCVGHLEDIQTLLPELEQRGYTVLAISPDDAEGMQKMADRMDRPYRFLSDANLKVTDLYGIRRDEELPHPAVIILDKKGLVQWFYVGEDYKQRPSAIQLREVIDRLDLQ